MNDIDAIKAMDAYAQKIGVKVTTLGQMAVQSRHAYQRIKNGTAHRDTERRVMEWIEADQTSRQAGAS